jgi:hypothetical protein
MVPCKFAAFSLCFLCTVVLNHKNWYFDHILAACKVSHVAPDKLCTLWGFVKKNCYGVVCAFWWLDNTNQHFRVLATRGQRIWDRSSHLYICIMHLRICVGSTVLLQQAWPYQNFTSAGTEDRRWPRLPGLFPLASRCWATEWWNYYGLLVLKA